VTDIQQKAEESLRELDKLADRLKANVRQLDTTMGKMDDYIMVSRPSNTVKSVLTATFLKQPSVLGCQFVSDPL
jgi:hypothetical protein